MGKVFSIANKLLSLRGQVLVTDEFDNVVYKAKGEFAFFSPTWRLYRDENIAATIRKKIFTFLPTWKVKSEIGNFAIKRKAFSLTRQHYIVGGKFNGVVLRGNIWDLKFEIKDGDNILSKVTGKILTLRDRHNVELLDETKDNELLTVISMLVLHLDRTEDAANASQTKA